VEGNLYDKGKEPELFKQHLRNIYAVSLPSSMVFRRPSRNEHGLERGLRPWKGGVNSILLCEFIEAKK